MRRKLELFKEPTKHFLLIVQSRSPDLTQELHSIRLGKAGVLEAFVAVGACGTQVPHRIGAALGLILNVTELEVPSKPHA